MYKAKVEWYNDYDDVDDTTYVIVCADSWQEAMKYVAEEFHYLTSVEMTELHQGTSHMIYLPPECVIDVTRENTW